MTDGILISELVVGGSALTSIAALVTAFIKRKVQISPSLCEERHKKLDDQISRLFEVCNQNARDIAALKTFDKRLDTLESKLDRILMLHTPPNN